LSLRPAPDLVSRPLAGSAGKLGWLRLARPGAYVALVALALVGTFVYKLRFDGIFACPASGYGANSYLADCQARSYGDYDHGALWFGLEPQALRAAAEAQVLFVGSSRLQLALSNSVTARWFEQAAARYFLLGFSHSENTVFVQPLLAKIRPQAKAYVINVDRFFDDRRSPPTEEILRGGDIEARYREKRFWQAPHAPLCAALPPFCGQRYAVYRSRATGAWTVGGSAPDQRRPVGDGPPADADRWARFAQLAQAFVAGLPVERSCVVLTIVPSVDTRRAEAESIAKALGLDLVAPQVTGLTTFDGSHLDAPSAQRWAAAFFEAAGPRLAECLRR
jgi:hypothetical protein